MKKLIKDIGAFSLVCIAFATPVLAPIIAIILGIIGVFKAVTDKEEVNDKKS